MGLDTKHIWLKVTHDKYELPLIVADTREELARKLNIRPNAISEQMSKAKKLGIRCQYIKVPREEGM